MPTLEVEKPKFKLEPWAKVLVAFLVLGLLVAAGWKFWQWRVAADKTAYEDTLATQKIDSLHQDYPAIVAAWEKYRSRWWPRNYDYEALMYESTYLQATHNNAKALALYKEAEARFPPQGTAVYTGIASLSEQAGDYATAIKYYQKAEDVYAKLNVGTSEEDWYHMHIIELKQKEQAQNASTSK